MEAKQQREARPDVWPTWPSPGIPVSADDWRRQAREAANPRPKPTAGATLARSAVVIAVAFVLSRFLGLVREVILANLFGTSAEYSAYVAAFRVPDLLFLVIMAGSFGAAFIPVFSGLLSSGRERDAWRLASVVLNLAAIALLVGASVAFVFAEPLVRYVVAPGTSEEVQRIATECMRILLLSPLFLGLGIAAKGILEAQDRFTLPAFAPVVYNISTILGAVLLGPRIGVYGVAIGVAVGALCHFLIQVPGLVQSRMRYTPSLALDTEGLGQVGRLLLPRLVGQAAFQLNFIVVTNLAWRSGEQSVSALNYAWQLLMLPHGVLALSISTVIFPTMARLYQAGNLTGLRETFGRALRPLLFLSLPAAVGLFFFRTAIVQTIFQNGAFSGASTELVAAPLAWFAVGLVGYALVEVLARAFYAMHDTRTPVVTGIAIIVLNIVLGVSLIDRYGFAALAFALSLSTAVEALALLVILRKRLGPAQPQTWRWLAKVAAATAVMGGFSWFAAPLVTAATVPGTANRLSQVALFVVALGVAALVYFVAAWLLGIPELRQGIAQVTRRLPLGRFRRPAIGDDEFWPGP